MTTVDNIKRRTFTPCKTLIEAGVTNIVAEIEHGIAKTISIEHLFDDAEPIKIEVTKQWYGDVRENFKKTAEKYFPPDTILQLDREIGAFFYVEVTDVEAHEHDKKAQEEKKKEGGHGARGGNHEREANEDVENVNLRRRVVPTRLNDTSATAEVGTSNER
jgi:hypothetical protein